MNWLIANREWVFSGVGVTILVGLIAAMKGIRKNRIHTHQAPSVIISQGSSNSVQLQSPSSAAPAAKTALLNLSAEQIMRNINELPPFQQPDAIQHYIGARITFVGNLASLWKIDENQVRMSLQPADKPFPLVRFNVSVNDYPEVKLLHEGTRLKVQGKIQRIEFGEFLLQEITLSAVP